MSHKNIPVTDDTKEKIDDMAKKSESYDDFVKKVLNFYEEYKQFKEFKEFKEYQKFKDKNNGSDTDG